MAASDVSRRSYKACATHGTGGWISGPIWPVCSISETNRTTAGPPDHLRSTSTACWWRPRRSPRRGRPRERSRLGGHHRRRTHAGLPGRHRRRPGVATGDRPGRHRGVGRKLPPAAGAWGMDDPAEPSAAPDVSGLLAGQPATLGGGAGWGPGQRGSALYLDGAGGLATTAAAVVRTDASFSVSAWVNSAISQRAPYGRRSPRRARPGVCSSCSSAWADGRLGGR